MEGSSQWRRCAKQSRPFGSLFLALVRANISVWCRNATGFVAEYSKLFACSSIFIFCNNSWQKARLHDQSIFLCNFVLVKFFFDCFESQFGQDPPSSRPSDLWWAFQVALNNITFGGASASSSTKGSLWEFNLTTMVTKTMQIIIIWSWLVSLWPLKWPIAWHLHHQHMDSLQNLWSLS